MKRLILAMAIVAAACQAVGQEYGSREAAKILRDHEIRGMNERNARRDEDEKLKTPIKGEPFRKWERTKSVAKLVAVSPDRVWFEKKDGQTISMDKTLLTQADKAILKIRLDKFAKDGKRLKAAVAKTPVQSQKAPSAER